MIILLALATFALGARAQTNLITVNTAHSRLALFVGHDQRLYQLAYGSSAQDLSAPEKDPARETEFLPQFGDGFVLEPALQATHADGNTSTHLEYISHSTSKVDDDATLTRIELKDTFYPFFVTICLKAYEKEDVIEQWTEIHHDEHDPVTLWRFASSSPIFKTGDHPAPRRLGQ
jgi:alpha-galactosidase